MSKQVKIALAALLLAAAGCCAALLLPRGQEGTVAVITHDGEVVEKIDLSKLTAPLTITVEGEDGLHNTIVAQPGCICVQSANCPDQVCVEQGWIRDSALPIVCLPNKLMIQITGGESGLDAVAK